MDRLSCPPRANLDEPVKGGRIPDVGKLADIPFDAGSDVVPVPYE